MQPRLASLVLMATLTTGCESALPDLPEPPGIVAPQEPKPEESRHPRHLVAAYALTPERRALLATLAAERRRWQTTRPREYRLEVATECFCMPGPPFRSHVRGDMLLSTTGGVPPAAFDIPMQLNTVKKLSAEAERLIRSNAEGVVVTYDPELASPATIDSDPVRDTYDDEWRWVAEMTVVER